MRTTILLVLLALACAACQEDFTHGDGDVDCDHPGGPGVYDQFDSATFQALWVQQGPGAVQFAAGAGISGGAFQLDPSGTACELRSDIIGASHVGISSQIYVAIDPTPGSGAQGTYAILDVNGVVLASLTVREGFIDYLLPGLAPQTFTWTTDGRYHQFRFLSAHSGTSVPLSRWERDGTAHFAGGLPVTDQQIRISIGGTSPADVFFEDAETYFLGDCPGA